MGTDGPPALRQVGNHDNLTFMRIESARNAAVLFVAALAVCGCLNRSGTTASSSFSSTGAAARSAVLFIADGMGPGYVTVTRVARGGPHGSLRLDELPHTAVMRTYASDSPVTDSAAAASALACGRKAPNGVICQDSKAVYGVKDGERLESIAMRAAKRGLRVGIVSTARVTHATPASFYATQNAREEERDIARQAIESTVDFILGGGREKFDARSPKGDSWSGDDSEDLEMTARRKGWIIVTTAEELLGVKSLGSPVLGLFARNHLPYEIEISKREEAGKRAARTAPTIVEMTGWAVDRLQETGDPFLLIVEGGRIDHAGHENRLRTLIEETIVFDRAVGYAIDRLDPENAMVLVTSDHETGGLTMNGYPTWEDGIWTDYEAGSYGEAYSVLTFMTGPGTGGGVPRGADEQGDVRPSGFRLDSGAHTGTDVTLYGWGKGADQVRGTLENTAVYWLLRSHLEGTEPDRRLLTDASP